MSRVLRNGDWDWSRFFSIKFVHSDTAGGHAILWGQFATLDPRGWAVKPRPTLLGGAGDGLLSTGLP